MLKKNINIETLARVSGERSVIFRFAHRFFCIAGVRVLISLHLLLHLSYHHK